MERFKSFLFCVYSFVDLKILFTVQFRVDEDLGPDSNWKCGSESFFKQSVKR